MSKQWNKKFIQPEEFHSHLLKLADLILNNNSKKYKYIYAIPRGGLVVGVYLSHYLGLDLLDENQFNIKCRECSPAEILIVDDLVDTGYTTQQYVGKFDIATVYMKPRSTVTPTYCVEECPNDTWIVFPWEKIEEEPNREV